MAGPRTEGEHERLEIPSSPPEIVATGTFNDLVRWLKVVPLLDENIKGFRPYLGAKMSHVKIPIDSVYPCALYALNSHIRIQKELRAKLLERYGLDTLNLPEDKSFLKIVWGNEVQFLYPAIVEVSQEDGGKRVITDGLHRYLNGVNDGETSITSVLVENIASPLPVLPVSWDEIKLYDKTPPLSQKRRLRFETPEAAIRWQSDNMDRFLKGFPEALLKEFGYKRYFKNLQDFHHLPASMLGIGNRSMFKLGETPPLEALMKYGRNLTNHDELYDLLGILNFDRVKEEPIHNRLLPLTVEGLRDLKKEWGIGPNEQEMLYKVRLKEDPFTRKGLVSDQEWWQVLNWDPECVQINRLNIQPTKLVEDWELVLIQYDGGDKPKPNSFLLGWLRKSEISRLLNEVDETIFAYDKGRDFPKQQLQSSSLLGA